jgi:hypothetical protein
MEGSYTVTGSIREQEHVIANAAAGINRRSVLHEVVASIDKSVLRTGNGPGLMGSVGPVKRYVVDLVKAPPQQGVGTNMKRVPTRVPEKFDLGGISDKSTCVPT